MPKVSKQTAGKIGLFSAIMIIFGAVVGIGVFFKNYAVFRSNNGNWIGVLISWLIAIIMVLCIAVSYGEIVTCKIKNKSEGLGGWAARFNGHHLGRLTKLMYTQVYYPVLTFAILFFTGEAALNIFGSPGIIDSFGKPTTLYIFLVGGGLFALFIFLNYYTSKGMTRFSNITGLIKFLPLAAVCILGIVFGILRGKNGVGDLPGQGIGLWEEQWWGQWTVGNADLTYGPTGSLDVTGIISCIPAVLFAFEGYLVIGNVAGDMENPEKNVPLSIIIAMIIISALNIAITVGCMTAGTGNVYHLMHLVANNDEHVANILNTIISVFIFICIIGVLNAMVFSGMRAFQVACADDTLFKGKALAKKKPGKLFAGAVYFSAMIGIWWIGIGIPSVLLNTDAIADASSMILVVMTYFLYGSTLLGGFANRFTNKVKVKKIKVFPVTAFVGVLACCFVICFSGFYENLVDVAIHPHDINPNNWGLFVQDQDGNPLPNFLNTTFVTQHGFIYEGFQWENWSECIVFWSITVVMFAIPFINDLLIYHHDLDNLTSLIWQAPTSDEIIFD